MRAETFQRALRATARVACAAALLGCIAEAPETSDDETDAALEADQFAEADAQWAPEADAAVEPDATLVAEADASPDTAREDCEEQLAETFSDPEPAPDDTDVACCDLLVEHADLNTEPLAQFQCCELLEWPATAACTPWGPPCPPAMQAVS